MLGGVFLNLSIGLHLFWVWNVPFCEYFYIYMTNGMEYIGGSSGYPVSSHTKDEPHNSYCPSFQSQH